MSAAYGPRPPVDARNEDSTKRYIYGFSYTYTYTYDKV